MPVGLKGTATSPWIDFARSISAWRHLASNLARKTALYSIASIYELPALVGTFPNVDTLCLDIHPAIKEWASDWDAASEARMRNIIYAIESQTEITRIVLISNGRLPVDGIESENMDLVPYQNANKPWNAAFLHVALGVDSKRTVVCGDQKLTDGLVAWAWACRFVHLSQTPSGKPRRVQLLNIGTILIGRFLPFSSREGARGPTQPLPTGKEMA
jgi:predicted HAD superfamily phosphohydrolase YqeG